MSTIDTEARLHVDTAGSWDGHFPSSQGDWIVEILTPYDWQIVVVSDRYTEACDAVDAAEIAVDAYHEREGHEVPWLAMGQPFYHVQAYRRSHKREPAHHGLVCMTEDGDWQHETERD